MVLCSIIAGRSYLNRSEANSLINYGNEHADEIDLFTMAAVTATHRILQLGFSEIMFDSIYMYIIELFAFGRCRRMKVHRKRRNAVFCCFYVRGHCHQLGRLKTGEGKTWHQILRVERQQFVKLGHFSSALRRV